MPTRHALHAFLLFLAACGGGSTEPTAEPASVTLSSTTVGFSSLNATLDLVATVRDANGTAISGLTPIWSTTASSVATVSNAGRVTAVANGSAQITASVGAIQSPAATVTVQQVAATLTLTPDTLRLAAAGDTMTIGATVRDAGGSVMTGVAKTFATVNPAVATVVVATGRVTAVADGATTVTGQVTGGSSPTDQVRIEVGGSLAPAYLVGGYVGTAYTDQIGPASGGGGAYTYAVTAGALPPGLSISSSTAQITGMPNTSGVHFFEVTATNGVLTLSERYAITISTKPASAFNLWITYNGGALPPTNARIALSAAAARWEAVITGDAGAAETYPSNAGTQINCSLVDEELFNSAFIEDIAILMALGTTSDGAGNTLARGGPCGFGRQTLPAVITGQMELDPVDAASASATYLQDVIQHEIAHVFGLGTLQNFTTGIGTPTPVYFGPNGKAEWTTLSDSTSNVPLEPDIGAHWNEGWFNGEIMTPTTEGPSIRMPISRLTIGALIDFGWSASLAAADAYTLPGCRPACSIRDPIGAPAGSPGEGVPFDEVVFDRLLPLPPGAVRGNE